MLLLFLIDRLEKSTRWYDSLLTDRLSHSSQPANCYALNLELANCFVRNKHICKLEASISPLLNVTWYLWQKKNYLDPVSLGTPLKRWERFAEICRSSHDNSVIKTRVFQIAWRSGEESLVRGMGSFAEGLFLLRGRNLMRSDFNHSNLFQCLKQHSVNIEHQLKSKLAWRVYMLEVKKWNSKNKWSY